MSAPDELGGTVPLDPLRLRTTLTPGEWTARVSVAWLGALREALATEAASTPSLVVCLDFKLAPAEEDVWDPAVFIGSTQPRGQLSIYGSRTPRCSGSCSRPMLVS